MIYYENILYTIGETPLVKLNRITRDLKPLVLAKLETVNPGGSIKDRMALYILEKARREGKLKPGGTIVEATSGNTGVAIAMYGAVMGYRVIITVIDKISQEKLDHLRAFGAEVVIVKGSLADRDRKAREIAESIEGAFYVDQHENYGNVEAHYYLTGPEIWKQTQGKITHFVAGMGTGGTLMGVCKYLKEMNPEIKCICVDPEGSVFYDYYQSGKIVKPKDYEIEGLGDERILPIIDFSIIDRMIKVTDKEAFLLTRRLAKEEGIFAGGSAGANLYGALKVAQNLGPDEVVVTVIPDTGFKYLSKIFNDSWMRKKGFLPEK